MAEPVPAWAVEDSRSLMQQLTELKIKLLRLCVDRHSPNIILFLDATISIDVQHGEVVSLRSPKRTHDEIPSWFLQWFKDNFNSAKLLEYTIEQITACYVAEAAKFADRYNRDMAKIQGYATERTEPLRVWADKDRFYVGPAPEGQSSMFRAGLIQALPKSHHTRLMQQHMNGTHSANVFGGQHFPPEPAAA